MKKINFLHRKSCRPDLGHHPLSQHGHHCVTPVCTQGQMTKIAPQDSLNTPRVSVWSLNTTLRRIVKSELTNFWPSHPINALLVLWNHSPHCSIQLSHNTASFLHPAEKSTQRAVLPLRSTFHSLYWMTLDKSILKSISSSAFRFNWKALMTLVWCQCFS